MSESDSTAKAAARICVPLRAETFGELERAIASAAQVADIIEIRLDALREQELPVAQQHLDKLILQSKVPVIVTFRPSEQGGYRELSIAERRQFWNVAGRTQNALFDIEKDLCASEPPLDIDWSRVICSHHDFTGVPEDINRLYGELASTPARILKLAVQANDIVDCLPVFHALERASLEGREIIALAMGDAGLPTRVLGPSRGSFLTYAPIHTERATAPGQVTAERLKAIYRLQDISQSSSIYGLVGSPVMHSISPHIHNAGFHAENVDAVYLPFEVKDLDSFMRRMVDPASRELNWRLRGLSITAPHKVEVMRYLTAIDPPARDIGAVNTVTFEGENLVGYNTDVDGFIEPLADAMPLTSDTRVAVIGAGGAANAAIWSLREKGVEGTVFARNLQKGQSLAERFGVSCKHLEGTNFEAFDVVVNATPLGSFGSRVDETPATAEQLRGVRLAYDLVYNPIETRFMREAKRAGCRTLGGLNMLVAQARLQFKLWTGRNAPVDVMRAAALRGLTSE